MNKININDYSGITGICDTKMDFMLDSVSIEENPKDELKSICLDEIYKIINCERPGFLMKELPDYLPDNFITTYIGIVDLCSVLIREELDHHGLGLFDAIHEAIGISKYITCAEKFHNKEEYDPESKCDSYVMKKIAFGLIKGIDKVNKTDILGMIYPIYLGKIESEDLKDDKAKKQSLQRIKDQILSNGDFDKSYVRIYKRTETDAISHYSRLANPESRTFIK